MIKHSGAALAGLDLGPVMWSSHSLVVIAGTSGAVIDANPAFRRLSGTMIGNPIGDLVGAGQGDAFRAWLDTAGPTWQTRSWGIFPDANGLPRDYQISACRGATDTLILIGEPLLTDDLTAGLLDVNESLVVEHRRLEHERGRLDRETRLDALTGLANRRAFDSRLAHEVDRTTRGSTFAVVMIDIDRFKSINDRFGHATGDVVLRWLGERLGAAARRGDFVARYGGEEFIAILPDAAPRDAVVWAERLRQVIRAVPPSPLEEIVTASFGVAGWAAGDTGQTVVDRADRGLYLAKTGGRDRVVGSNSNI
ncbi:MAG: sensor domain-containing diguanylate cyclase [Pseudomonadota bacterium]|nr:sensor domain-containing diguanylate cyclase [Pseudomonadota bacterium]